MEDFNQDNLEINLDQLDYIDSIGVAGLNFLREKFHSQGIRIN